MPAATSFQGLLDAEVCATTLAELSAQISIFSFELRESFADWVEGFLKLLHGVAGCDVLWAVPVEGFDVDKDDALDDVGLVCGTERFDKRWSFGIVLVDLDAAKNLEAGLVG